MTFTIQNHRITINDSTIELFEKYINPFTEVEQKNVILEAFGFVPLNEIFAKYSDSEIGKMVDKSIRETVNAAL